MYRSASQHYRGKFGCKVYKLSLDAGFTCPNRDGTLGTGGCIFCGGDGSGAFAAGPCGDIRRQLEEARRRVAFKAGDNARFIAYFQAFTNTYGPLNRLRELYTQAMEPEYIVGLAIGTRPDCLDENVVALLQEMNQMKPICVELGLQTIHPAAVQYIRRGYENSVYEDAVKRLKEAGLEVVTHIILGLPGETAQMAAQTTRYAVSAGTDGVKFHLLHVLKGTALARDYEAGSFDCLTLEEYGHWLIACLEQVPAGVTVHRITGDGAKRDLIAPMWSADKKRVLKELNHLLGGSRGI